MRKALATILALTFGMSVWADGSPDRPTEAESFSSWAKNRPAIQNVEEVSTSQLRRDSNTDRTLPSTITPTSRDPETWYLYIEDTYGDGWGGSSITLNVNDTELGVYTLTADEGDDLDGDGYIDDNYAIYEFEVDDWSYMVGTFAVNDNGWPGECLYGFYDAAGDPVVEGSGATGAPIDATVDQAGRMSVMANGGYEGGIGGWGSYPSQSFDVLTTGDGMYNSDDLFEAYDGNKSFKMWGLYWGWEDPMENQIFQEWGGDASWGHDEVPAAGSTFDLSAYLMSHNADFIGQGNSHAKLMVKYFGDGNGGNWWDDMILMDESTHFDGTTATADTWDNYTLSSTVPEGTWLIQLGFMLVQPSNDDHGSVFVDNFVTTLTTTDCETNEFVITVDGGLYQSEVSWTVTEHYTGAEQAAGGAPITADDGVTACLADGAYVLNMTDSWGDGWNGNVFTMWTVDEAGAYTAVWDTTLTTGEFAQAWFLVGETGEVLGCTDPEASNYDATATINNGTCLYGPDPGDTCEDPLTAAVGANDAPQSPVWYSYTATLSGTAIASSAGSGVDTQVYGYSGTCEALTQVGFGDDETDAYESIMSFSITAGETYYIHWTDYWSTDPFTWTLEEVEAGVPSGLTTLGGLERVYLGWSPAQPPAATASYQSAFDGTVDEHIEMMYAKKENQDPEYTYEGRTRESLMIEIANHGSETRDTEVIVTLFDSYGDGHYGGDCDGCAYIVDADGNVLETLEGGWTGTENAYGPFTLADGQYDVVWDETASWLSEQSMEVTDAADATISYGAGNAPAACFALGEGFACGSADLTITGMTIDSWTGQGTATVSNVGSLDAGGFYTMTYYNYPDTLELFTPGYVVYGYTAGLAAGETVEVPLIYGTFPGFLGGYDGVTYDVYGYVDSWGDYIVEAGGDQNNIFGPVAYDNTSPLANSSWNVWQSINGGEYTTIANVTDPSWLPGGTLAYTDEGLTADVEHCYMITQINSDVESSPTNPSCATPSAAPDVPAPSDLAGSSSGFDVTLTWTSPPPYDGGAPIFSGEPSSLRQGGDTMEDATVVTELGQLTGTTVGYTDSYDEVCPYSGATSPDVVYSFTPETDVAVNMTTCYSTFDTKLYVYENEVGVLASTTTGDPACSDDTYPPGVDDCTAWTSYLEGVSMSAGNTYYLVVDGYGYSEGDYVLDVDVYNPLAGFTIWGVDGDNYSVLGNAGPNDTEWSTVLFAAEPTDISLAITATYFIPGIFDPVVSDVVGPVTVTVQLEDNPAGLMAMDYGDDVHLMWEPPIDATNMELAYDDGVVANAWWYAGAVAVRFRVNGTYAINGLANAVWTGGWPDAYLGETPFTLSVLAVDEATDLPGDTLYQESVLVDADPTSETYGWAMTSALAESPVTVTGDVFIMYSDFGYDFENNGPGPDMDMMGCDAVLDFPGNKYDYNVSVPEEWALSVEYGSLACGDWNLHMNADFTVGNGASFGNDGVWVDAMGQPNVSDLPPVFANMEAASTKEMPMELMNPPVSGSIWTNDIDRNMTSYNIYRDGAMVDTQDPMYTEYWDHDLEWGTYTYYVTAQYDGHESIATNEVEVTLSNVAPDAVMLISPADGFSVEVTESNLDEEVAFIWTAANDADNDPLEYILSVDHDGEMMYLPENTLMNASFEDYADVEGSDWQQLPADWEGYPHMNNMDVVANGEDLGFGAGTFEAFDGEAALKIWGLYEGEGTENNVFQTWFDGMLPPGTQFWVSAEMMSPAGDFIGNGNNHVVLFAKYFTADWGWLGMHTSEPFSAENAVGDEWHYAEAMCEVPEGASTVQVGAMYVQATNDDHGPVMLDDFYMHIPLTTTGFFVSNGMFADLALEAGVNDVTVAWDVWSFDGFEATPSSSGSRELNIHVDEAYASLHGVDLPTEFALHNNYPNPFNPVTNILYDIPEVSDVSLEIYNVMGQRVRTLVQGTQEPGRYQIIWNATNDFGQALSSGMYIYRIQAGDFVSVKKLVLMK